MMSEADHLDAFTRLSEMELLQDSINSKLKTAHARCVAGTIQESMLPISRHFYPKCKKNVTTCEEFFLASLPQCQAVMNKTQGRQSWFIYGNMPIWMTSNAGNQLGMDVKCSRCDKCHGKCSVKMMDLIMTTMTLMMNALHLLKMKVNKIEGCLTHAMNAPINII